MISLGNQPILGKNSFLLITCSVLGFSPTNGMLENVSKEKPPNFKLEKNKDSERLQNQVGKMHQRKEIKIESLEYPRLDMILLSLRSRVWLIQITMLMKQLQWNFFSLKLRFWLESISQISRGLDRKNK